MTRGESAYLKARANREGLTKLDEETGLRWLEEYRSSHSPAHPAPQVTRGSAAPTKPGQVLCTCGECGTKHWSDPFPGINVNARWCPRCVYLSAD